MGESFQNARLIELGERNCFLQVENIELRILLKATEDEKKMLCLMLQNFIEEKTGECSAIEASPKTQQGCGHGITNVCTLCQLENIYYILNHKSSFIESSSTTSSKKEKKEEMTKLQEKDQASQEEK